jgi:hypothetical protein
VSWRACLWAVAITVVFCRRITIVRGCFYVIAQLGTLVLQLLLLL